MRLLRRSWDLFRNVLGWVRRNRRGRRAAAAKRRATLRRHAYDRLEARVVLNADAVDDELSTGYGVPAVIAHATLTANDSGTGTLAVTSFSATTAQGGSVDDVGGNLIYTPPANFSGDDSFTYQLTDDDATTDTATVTLHVAPQPPLEAHDDTFTTNEDTPGWPELSGNDDLPASWSLELVEGPSHGTLPSLWYYVPDANYAGPDSFRYRLTDGVRTSEATVSITVNAVNDAPTAEHRTYAMDEDGTLERTAADGLLVGAADVEGDGLAAELASQAAHGTATVAGDGSFTYTPNANFSGVDSFTYRVFDGTDYSAARTVSITVNPTDDDLEAVDDEGVTDEDTAVAIEAGLNDFDPDESSVLTIVTQPEHGTVDVESGGVLRYAPHANWHGTDSFTYRRSDGVHQDDATVTVTVTPVNDPPTAADDELTTDEDGPLALSSALTANDSDVEGDAQIEILSQPEHGAVGVVEGVLTFTPEADWFGTTAFTYRLIDADYQSAAATVTVTVAPVNDAPTSAGRAYDVDEDQTLTVGAENGLLVDAADVESNSIAVTPYDGATAQGGHVVVAADGSFTYTPAADFHGTDSFDYELSDGSDTSVAAATITVAPVNDAPTAASDSRTIDEDTSLSVGGSDVDGDPLTAVVVAQPSHGTLTIDGGSVSYMPDANWSGSDSFQYRVNDGSAESSTATVWITVNPVNDAPWAADESHTAWVTHNQTDGIAVPQATNYGDVDGDGLNVSYDSTDPTSVAPGQSGSRSYSVTDPSGASAGGTVHLTVNVYDNRGPSAGDDQLSLDEDTSITFDPRANDSDADGDGLIVSLVDVAGPQHGTVALNGDGTLTYTPEADYYGGDSFQYRVDDGWGGSSVGTVGVTVRSVNDAPSFTAGADVTVDEDSGAYSQSWASQIGVGPANESNQQPTFSVTVDDASLFTAEGGPRISAGGTLSFTPAPNAHGTTTVTVWLNDDGGTAANGQSTSPAVTFTLTIASINDPPTAAGRSYTVSEDSPLTVTMENGLVAGAVDIDGDLLTVVPFSGNTTAGGTIIVQADGAFTYTPRSDFYGMDSVEFQIADGTVVTTAIATFDVVPVNDAPTTVGIGELVPVTGENANNQGTLVSHLTVGQLFTDVDGPAEGIAVIGLDTTNGYWQYRLKNASTWQNMPSVSDQNALLLVADDDTRIRFIPTNSNFSGDISDALTYRVWDRSDGRINGTSSVDVASCPCDGPFSAQSTTACLRVQGENDAPGFLAGSHVAVTASIGEAYAFPRWAENIAAGTGGAGQTIDFLVDTEQASLFTSGGQPAISADGTLTFVASGIGGTATVRVRAHDDGEGDETIPVSQLTISITASANNAPVLRGGPTWLDSVSPDAVNSGTSVADLLDRAGPGTSTTSTRVFALADADPGSQRGIAVSGVDETRGSWEYSLDSGTTWRSMGDVSESRARLLDADASHRVRFISATGVSGVIVEGLTFHAWDRTEGKAGETLDARRSGGSSSLSITTASATVTVLSTAQQTIAGAAGSSLGSTIAADGRWMVVGVPDADLNGVSNVGSVQVYERVNDVWTLKTTLSAPSADRTTDSRFGAVADVKQLSDGALVVIADSTGKVYAWENHGGGWANTPPVLVPSGGVPAGAHFGSAIAVLDDQRIAVAATHYGTNPQHSGAVYLFKRSANGLWSEPVDSTGPWVPANVASATGAGGSLAADGNTLVVGTVGTSGDDPSQTGKAWVLTITADGAVAGASLLTPPVSLVGWDQFGSATAVDGDSMAIGAQGSDTIDGVNQEVGYQGNDRGAVYLYRRTITGQTAIWTYHSTILAPDGRNGAWFGAGLALDGENLVVGSARAERGSIYVYRHEDQTWNFVEKLAPDANIAGKTPTALADGWAFSGSPARDGGAGALFSWRLNGAPQLAVVDGVNTWLNVATGQADDTGTLVVDLLTRSSNNVSPVIVSDVDADFLRGIAVVHTDTANGTWQYRLADNDVWHDFGDAGYDQARLLAADATT